MSNHKFPYKWKISDGYPAKGIENHGYKVFGTFICGGGSSMGYKLAGYNHLGGVEIDSKIAEIYRANNHPKYLYNEDIRTFNERTNLPDELLNLDLLDGSPPCSTFSMAGSREKAWGKKKKFAEGQSMQTLDDLVFVYCDTIEKLQPKICLLENVSGLVKGNAKAYAKQIINRMNGAGYRTQVFLLSSHQMGVPQNRQRVFFIGLRKDFNLPKLKLNFNEEPILFREIETPGDGGDRITALKFRLWEKRKIGDKDFGKISLRIDGKEKYFTNKIVSKNDVVPTITTKTAATLFHEPRQMNATEVKLATSYPLDYNAPKEKIVWLCGMSVPPIMTAQIAHEIYKQWLSKIN